MMTTSPNKAISAPDENLRRLLSLRALNISGQLTAILTAIYYLGLDLPIKPLVFIFIGLMAWSLLSLLLLKKTPSLTDTRFFVQLIVDVFALTAILYFTGGATNPFAWFLLVPQSIASTLLSRAHVWLMALLTSLSYTLLVFYYQPLVYVDHPMDMGAGGHFAEHIIGMWIGFVLSTFLLAYFVAGMAESLRKRNELLSQMQERMFRDERLVALGTLATGAAHELGTPLGTMSVVAHELKLELEQEGNQSASQMLTIINGQIKRCKEVLSSITETATTEKFDAGQLLPVVEYIEKVIAQWRISNLNVNLIEVVSGKGAGPKLISDIALTRALINILDNAAQVSPHYVRLTINWNNDNINLMIEDEGKGMDEVQLIQLGKHMMTSKDDGLGIGIYITQATLERLGGDIKWENRQPKGVRVAIHLPLIK
jgi:two-component system sensor histidine kinase RegB